MFRRRNSRASCATERLKTASGNDCPMAWNDAPGQTKENVIATLRRAAA